MELTPQLLTDEIDFRIAVRGYDRNEVDDFLERVAVAVGQLQSQLGKAVARAKAAEKRLTELEAPGSPGTRLPSREQPAVVVSPTEPEAKDEPASPVVPPPAAPMAISSDEDLNEELRRTLVLAQRTADSAIREAREEAETIVEGAHADARRAVQEAEAESARTRDEARRRLIDEIAELESVREAMRNDTIVLERYLGDERAKVRETIQVLRRLVDEPRSLQVAPVPELSEAKTPIETPALGAGAPEPESAPTQEPANEPEATPTSDAAAPAEPESTPEDAASAPAQPASTPVVTIPETAAEPGAESDGAPEPKAEPDAGSQTSAPEAAAAPQPSSANQDEGQALGRLFDTGEAPRDWRSGGTERGDQGPHTQPVAAARFEEETDDAFLAELRRAMADNEPLGPGDAGRSREDA